MRIGRSNSYCLPMVIVTLKDEPINPVEIMALAKENDAVIKAPLQTENLYLVKLPQKYRFDNMKGEDLYTSAELHQTINPPTGREATIWHRTSHLD